MKTEITSQLIVSSKNFSSFKLIIKNRTKPNTKFVKYVCTNGWCGGWADRIEGIFSTYAFSLLADRDFSIYIDSPCSIKTLIEPNEIDWNAEGYTNITNLTTKRFHLIDNFAFIKQLETIDVPNFEKDTNLITIENNQQWLTALSSNQNLSMKIKILGYEPSRFQIKYLTYNW